MLAYAYSAIKKRLTELDQLKMVDWYMQQDLIEDESVLLWTAPAVFIEFAPVQWKDMGASNIQNADLVVTIYLVTENANEGDQAMINAEADNHLMLESKIYQQLAKFRADMSYVTGGEMENSHVILETMTRLRSETEHQLARTITTKQVFTAKIFDYSARPDFQTVEIQPIIETKFKNEG